MERIYVDEVMTPDTGEANEFLLELIKRERNAKDYFNEEEYKIWIISEHDNIRKIIKLPNKLFGFNSNAEFTKARIVLFPKEPDGNYYHIFVDEEKKLPYILVE